MKIQKVFAFILSQVLCLFSISTVSLSGFADDAVDFEKVYVSAVVNGKNQNLQAIQNKDGNVFFSGKTLSDVTVYNNNTSDYLFEHDNVDLKHKYRSIRALRKRTYCRSVWVNLLFRRVSIYQTSLNLKMKYIIPLLKCFLFSMRMPLYPIINYI